MADEARIQYGLGIEAFENEQFEEALEHFQKSNAIAEHFKTWHRLAKVLDELGHEREAEECYERAYSQNPKNSQVAVDYAETLVRQHESGKALDVINGVLRKNASYGPAQKLKAHILDSSRD